MKKIFIVLFLLPTLVFGQGAIEVTFTNQADFDAYNFQSDTGYIVTLNNDTTLSESQQINSLLPLINVNTGVTLYLFNTLITSLDGIQHLSVLGLIMEGNKNWDTLYIPDNVKSLSLQCENTYLKYIHGAEKVTELGFVYLLDNDNLKDVHLSLAEWDSDDYPSWLIVEQNDSLKTFYWGNPHHHLYQFRFFENRQLKHIHLETVAENVNSGVVEGIYFNIELDSITGFKDLQVSKYRNIQKNYKLDQVCVLQEATQNAINLDPSLASTFKIYDNGPNLQSLNDLLNADCSWLPNGVAEVANQEMALYPNPAHNEVFVEVPKTITNYRIYDMSGKVVKSGTVEASGRIGLQGISGGMYILQVNENRSKLVVQ